ncbi:hypothetical protein [Janthinobacterium lividum]
MKRGRRKLSSAASSVAQVKTKMAQGHSIEYVAHARIEQSMDSKTGDQILTAIFPQKGGCEPHRVDLSFLLAFPNLQQLFTEAFLRWGSNVSAATRTNAKGNLSYFFGYIGMNWPSTLHPGEIDDELLADFKDRLLRETGQRGKPLHPTTIGRALGAVRSIMDALDTGPWADMARYISERVPPGPIGGNRKSIPTEVLDTDLLLSIIEVAEREVLIIEQRFSGRNSLLEKGRLWLQDPRRSVHNNRCDYEDLAVCLAALEAAYPGTIPNLPVIRDKYPALGWAIESIHGQTAVCSYFYPSGRDLVPFVLLLTITTVFNADTVLSLDWGDISFEKEQAGSPAIEIIGTKGRASKDLVRLLDPDVAVSSQLGLKRMLSCLQNITSRIRPEVSVEHMGRLFLFVQKVGTKRPKGFGLNGQRFLLPSNDPVWKKALQKFIADNKLSQFNLSQLRPTILDLVQFMDGSLEAARLVGNHGNPVTTWTHYTSAGIRKRYRERIGQVIVLRERWLDTNGVIDPRRLTFGEDKGAATPGFSCLDPFNSQRPNQQPGRLCKDYGGCPSCPMAAAHPSDPICVAYYTALEVAIYRSQAFMSAKTWIERWVPVLADLKALRVWIPADVMKASMDFSVQLPNVG